ncbi:hypothetical protein HanXRQr2_Chr10g0445921 [Helianthus annuus]|nr:hypothetical protein HanXRQr2_Chr10g0445921 [Helianthus annuus]
MMCLPCYLLWNQDRMGLETNNLKSELSEQPFLSLIYLVCNNCLLWYVMVWDIIFKYLVI